MGKIHIENRLSLVLVLTIAYLFAELIGGLASNSLSLLADAGHMLADSSALSLSWIAMWIAKKPANPKKTYGYRRMEVLAALINAFILLGIVLYIMVEAIHRLQSPHEVLASIMVPVAFGGLLVNLLGIKLLASDPHHNINIKGARLHLLTDALGNVGVLTSGFFILLFHWYWMDAVVSIVIGLLVTYSATMLLKETWGVLMEGAPAHLDVEKIRSSLAALPNVINVHELHVWTVSSGLDALSVHLLVHENSDSQVILQQAHKQLRKEFAITHPTIQVEKETLGEEICAHE